MDPIPNCPECDFEYACEDGPQLACPDRGQEWVPSKTPKSTDSSDLHAHRNPLADGDTLVKDLKVKDDLKAGTKVKSVRLCAGDRNLYCKISGFGAMKLKSQFVKKILSSRR